jgi:hypothetical protein
MRPTSDTRKPIDDLTSEDLDAFAVWEFAEDEEHIEGRDETWVRPLIVDRIPRRISPCGVRAELVTAAGEVLRGLVWVTAREELIADAAAGFSEGRYGYLHPADLEKKALFPIFYRLAVAFDLEERPRTGSIPATSEP